MNTTVRRGARGLALALALTLSFAVASSASAAPVGATAVPAALAAAPAKGTELFVDKASLRLRWGPGWDRKTRLSGLRDARLVATGKTSGEWVQVKAGGLQAWAPAKYVTLEKPRWKPIYLGSSYGATDLRSKPYWSAPVVATAQKGTVGKFMRFKSYGWWRIQVDGRAAWVRESDVTVGGYFDVDRILEVAHAEVGYREPSFQKSKYNAWIGGTNPWCEVFVAWVFDKGGYRAGVPKHDTFRAYAAELRSLGILDMTPTGGELRKGDVVLLDWGLNDGPKHTGIVDHVSGSSVFLVEGNTTSGTGDPTRGVFYRERPISWLWAWYRPSDYARATM